jgi:hypothetical protein
MEKEKSGLLLGQEFYACATIPTTRLGTGSTNVSNNGRGWEKTIIIKDYTDNLKYFTNLELGFKWNQSRSMQKK